MLKDLVTDVRTKLDWILKKQGVGQTRMVQERVWRGKLLKNLVMDNHFSSAFLHCEVSFMETMSTNNSIYYLL
jgi:hypothetical protein